MKKLQNNEEAKKYLDKELRILAKQTALRLNSMSNRSRDIVFESFQKIDFYDVDLVQEFKRLKMIK